MKTLLSLGVLGLVTMMTAAGCAADPADEEVGDDEGSAVSRSVDLKYEGTCDFLHSCSRWSRNLPDGHVLWGCTGEGSCDDDALWVAGPYRSSCGKTVRICKGTRCVNALVKDISVSHSWEASNGVLDALGISHRLFGQCSGSGGGRVTIDDNPGSAPKSVELGGEEMAAADE